MSPTHRLLLGVVLLFIVDLIWVVSSEITEHIFNDERFRKPYFTTYVKTSTLVINLIGFLVLKSWWRQCRRERNVTSNESETDVEADNLLGDSIYVPLGQEEKFGSESDESGSIDERTVRFSNLMEVRQFTDLYAEEAMMSRMSYQAYLQADEARMRNAGKLPVNQIMRISLMFCFIFFFGNLAYQEALSDTQAGIVNVLSSTSSLFTLVLASVFPSSAHDKFTLTKLFAVIFSMTGVVVVTFSDKHFEARFPKGAVWAIVGALMYAIYLVLLRKNVKDEQKFNTPMFFGFVGLFIAVFLWPVFLVLDYTNTEKFELPNETQWAYLLVNGLVGTVIAELLWLWGCFLTSSLVATLSLSLTIPMSMIADTIVKGVHYNWLFYCGSLPVFLSFILVSILTHYEGCDPLMTGCRKLVMLVDQRRGGGHRNRDLDDEQRESLIGINSEEPFTT